jgi:hypothetical protein
MGKHELHKVFWQRKPQGKGTTWRTENEIEVSIKIDIREEVLRLKSRQ